MGGLWRQSGTKSSVVGLIKEQSQPFYNDNHVPHCDLLLFPLLSHEVPVIYPLLNKPISHNPVSPADPRPSFFHPRVERRVTTPSTGSGLAGKPLSNPSDQRTLACGGNVASESLPTVRQGSTPIFPSQRYNGGRGIIKLDNQRRPTIRFEDEDPTLRSMSYPSPSTRTDLDAPPKSNSH